MPTTRTGPTPLGGVRSVAYLFDASGAEVEDPDRAVRGEIAEVSAEGMELGRTYFELAPLGDAMRFSSPGSAGLEQTGNEPSEGADDPKASWDLWTGGFQKPVDRLPELLSHLGLTEDADLVVRLRAVCAFMELPAWDAAPDKLKREVYGWLESNRQE